MNFYSIVISPSLEAAMLGNICVIIEILRIIFGGFDNINVQLLVVISPTIQCVAEKLHCFRLPDELIQAASMLVWKMIRHESAVIERIAQIVREKTKFGTSHVAASLIKEFSDELDNVEDPNKAWSDKAYTNFYYESTTAAKFDKLLAKHRSSKMCIDGAQRIYLKLLSSIDTALGYESNKIMFVASFEELDNIILKLCTDIETVGEIIIDCLEDSEHKYADYEFVIHKIEEMLRDFSSLIGARD